jgi:hypothetical protein
MSDVDFYLPAQPNCKKTKNAISLLCCFTCLNSIKQANLSATNALNLRAESIDALTENVIWKPRCPYRVVSEGFGKGLVYISIRGADLKGLDLTASDHFAALLLFFVFSALVGRYKRSKSR